MTDQAPDATVEALREHNPFPECRWCGLTKDGHSEAGFCMKDTAAMPGYRLVPAHEVADSRRDSIDGLDIERLRRAMKELGYELLVDTVRFPPTIPMLRPLAVEYDALGPTPTAAPGLDGAAAREAAQAIADRACEKHKAPGTCLDVDGATPSWRPCDPCSLRAALSEATP